MAIIIFRIIDVNLNRACEATRVIEDYARFILDNKPLYDSARSIRHQLVTITKPLSQKAIYTRNIETDIGKTNLVTAKTSAEVLISNLKRLQESLRSIIEYLKTDYPALSQKIEPLRFQAYQLEQEFHYILYPNKQLAESRLYVLISGSDIWELPLLLENGADMIQLRAKGIEDKELLAIAKTVRRLTAKYRKLFIMNDRADVAYLSNADGVHLGKEDINIKEARKILGADKIIGATSHNLKEALQAQKEGADYISVGPFYQTPTKPSLTPGGFNYLKDVVKHIRIPYFLIGGINTGNIRELKKYYCRLAKSPLNIAVSSGILSQQDIAKAAKQIRKPL